jgi:hypothetical protein
VACGLQADNSICRFREFSSAEYIEYSVRRVGCGFAHSAAAIPDIHAESGYRLAAVRCFGRRRRVGPCAVNSAAALIAASFIVRACGGNSTYQSAANGNLQFSADRAADIARGRRFLDSDKWSLRKRRRCREFWKLQFTGRACPDHDGYRQSRHDGTNHCGRQHCEGRQMDEGDDGSRSHQRGPGGRHALNAGNRSTKQDRAKRFRHQQCSPRHDAGDGHGEWDGRNDRRDERDGRNDDGGHGYDHSGRDSGGCTKRRGGYAYHAGSGK